MIHVKYNGHGHVEVWRGQTLKMRLAASFVFLRQALQFAYATSSQDSVKITANFPPHSHDILYIEPETATYEKAVRNVMGKPEESDKERFASMLEFENDGALLLHF